MSLDAVFDALSESVVKKVEPMLLDLFFIELPSKTPLFYGHNVSKVIFYPKCTFRKKNSYKGIDREKNSLSFEIFRRTTAKSVVEKPAKYERTQKIDILTTPSTSISSVLRDNWSRNYLRELKIWI